MMDAQRAFELYRTGLLTSVGLASELFGLIDESNIESIMAKVPPRSEEKLRSLIENYRAGESLRLNVESAEVTPENAFVIRDWFDRHSRSPMAISQLEIGPKLLHSNA